MNYIEEAKANFLKKEESLSPYARKSSEAIRLSFEEEDIRTPFFHDIDRIIHDLSYTRYLDKTQVFTHSENDHVSKRMTHVQLVSKIARTIGRSLSLNEDLIEAIALGHDIGHTPLGHSGEAMLDKICKEHLGCTFAHNVESVRYYMAIAKNGEGLNLCIETLDGILMHNGEILEPIYRPLAKTKEEFLKEYEAALVDVNAIKKSRPMTLEGCVVRLSDIIGYIGRDIEDAILIGRLKRSDIPQEIKEVLGCTNKEIVNTLILDIIKESMGKPYIKMSDKVYQALLLLKDFNMEKIYSHSMNKETYHVYEVGMQKLYDKYLNDLKTKNKKSIIYKTYLDTASKDYLSNTPVERQVIDYIAGMTDAFFIKQLESLK